MVAIFKQKVAFQWLNQASDPLTYTPDYVSNGNSPKCIWTGRFDGYSGEGANITLTSEEDTGLCRLANGDFDSYDDVSDNHFNSRGWDSIWRRWDWRVASKITGVSLSGRILITKENKGTREASFHSWWIQLLCNPSMKSREKKDRHWCPIVFKKKEASSWLFASNKQMVVW